jgi:hypothetical protein
MAIKTWIGTTANWNVASNWSPASVPSVTDDLVFNNSANANVNAAYTFKSIDFTGYTGTLSGASAMVIAGSTTGTSTGISLALSSGMTITYTGGISFTGTNGGYLYFNGKSISSALTFNNATGVWSTQDVLVSSAAVTLTTGTLNINANLTTGTASTLTLTAGTMTINNGANITCAIFSSNNTNTRTLNMGSGTWNLIGTGSVWAISSTTAIGITLNAQQSRILISNTVSPTSIITFSGGGLTYYTVEYARGAATATFIIQGSNTYANFIDNTSTVAHTYSWQSLSTQTFYKFNVRGASAGARISFASSSGTAANLVKVGQGVVCNCNYLAIGGNTSCSPTSGVWYAGANSTGSGGNWTVTNAPSSQSVLGVGGVG